MKKKVVYLTQWVAKDKNKEYPHGWGFEPPLVEFSQDMDAAEAAKHCRELSNDEFECTWATPKELIDGDFEILGIVPGPEKDSEEWAMRDIDIVLDHIFADSQKLKDIRKIVQKYFSQKPHQ